MDGTRRRSQSMTANPHFRPDCSRGYRVAARSFGVLFLAATIISGVIGGGHLNYPGSSWMKLPGQVAGLFGLAALDIKMTGLQHHEANEVLTAIDVRPGGPLLGFDAKRAREKLQSLDWIESAGVTRSFPNQLHIEITEREPFVVWQHDGAFQVVDRKGTPMGGISPTETNVLLQVVGERANEAAADLVNQMEVTPELFQDVKAATYIGGRRWNLLMKNNLTIALPERDVVPALRSAQLLYFAAASTSGKLKMLDLRVAGEVAYHAATSIEIPAADPRVTSSIQ
jgi:cell division protein FtsQ